VPLEKGKNLLLWWSKHEGQFSNCSIWLRNEENIFKVFDDRYMFGDEWFNPPQNVFFSLVHYLLKKIYYPMLFFEFLCVTL